MKTYCKGLSKEEYHRRYRLKNADSLRSNWKKYYEKNKSKLKKISSLWKKQNRAKARLNWYRHHAKELARLVVRHAIRDGKLKRLPCEKCGKTPTHAHHSDYSKPLMVAWLCPPCHAEVHFILKHQPKEHPGAIA